jgi:transposase
MNKASIATNKTDEDAAIQAMDPAVYRLDIGADADINTLLDVIDKKSSVIEEQKQRIAILEEYLRLERARRFGPTSEKYAGQAELLFDEAEAIEQESSATAALEELQEQHGIQKKRGRKGLSKQLLRHQVHINLSDEEKAGAIDTFYTVAKEELDIVPAKARVIEYLQEKAVFIEGNSRQVKTAELPKHPLNKCIASVSLLAYVIVSKFCDGLALYGLESILKRHGGDISRTSMANWVIRLSIELQPLINLMREHQLSYDYLQIDETRIKV